jgi:K+-sensing histidine kinase KdpD
MAYQKLHIDYIRGKQIICLLAIILSIVGFVLDAVTYSSIYSNIQTGLQIVTVTICTASLALYLVDRNKFYVYAFALLSYSVIINILFTTLYIHTFIEFVDFTQANILSRDILFVVLYIVLSGFIIGRIHIFVQGLILLSIILYFIVILKEPFFLENAAIYLSSILSFLAVLYFFVGTLNNLIAKLEEANVEAHDLRLMEAVKKQNLIKFQNSILRLAQDETFFRNDLKYLFEKICTTATTDLAISRVSIWTLEENNAKLVRKYLQEQRSGNNEHPVLMRSDFPEYFQALETEPFIAANNAFEHACTKEFSEVYLKPLAIFSLMDCPIIVDGKAVGVICCENQNDYREWTTEDILFIQSLAVHISISYKNILIHDLLDEVKLRNVELVDKSREIEAMNEELTSLNEELGTLNETLEATVRRRTSELETQNKQLTEYAFINSHILRAPLARVLGLAHLFSQEASPMHDQELIQALIHSSNELDSIIRKISDLLYDGNNLSREDIQVIIDRTINKVS